MEEETNIPLAEASENQDIKPRSGAIFIGCIVLAIIATLAAWGAMLYIPGLSFWLSVAGIVLSIAGLWVGRCCWRDISITVLIAAAVLFLVHVIFNFALDYAMSSLSV